MKGLRRLSQRYENIDIQANGGEMTWPITPEADSALKDDAWRLVLRFWPEAIPEGLWAGETPEARFENLRNYHQRGFKDIFENLSGWKEAKKIALSEATWRTRKSIEFEWNFAAEDNALSVYRDKWLRYVKESLKQVQKIIVSKDSAKWGKLVDDAWKPLAMLPITGAAEFSPSRAETICTEFMLFMGAEGAVTTRGSKDNGLDIVANHFVAQVKHLHSKVGVKAMREFLGASVSTKKIPVFFSRSGFTEEARNFAIENKMLAFSYVGHFDAETPLSAISTQVGFIGEIKHQEWMDRWWDNGPYSTAAEKELVNYRNKMRNNRWG